MPAEKSRKFTENHEYYGFMFDQNNQKKPSENKVLLKLQPYVLSQILQPVFKNTNCTVQFK